MRILDWLKASNRWKHLLGGAAIGLFASDWYCALYAGTAAGAALELKDRAYATAWDWVDLALTILGAAIGHAIHYGIKTLIQ